MTATPLTVLDLVPISSGSNATRALPNSIDLARQTERLGYARYWFAEHHLNPGVAGTSPAVVLALTAAATSTIRLGSGAVQMGHRTALSTVEEFGLLDALHPGRFDLGLGRSGGRPREAVPPSVEQLTPFGYRDPAKLPDGGVLVVGASAIGVQLAAELQRSGRPVTLSVGEHVRLPRTYRGRDVLWWMDASGVWDQRYDEIEDLTRARRLPSPQLVGTPERTTLDLNALASMGVELVGRWAAVRDGSALFSGGLRNVFSLADLKMRRLLDTFDEWALTSGRDAEFDLPERFAPTRVPSSTRLQLDLDSGEIRSVVWATGFRPDYGWLDVPVVDAKGQLRHEGGVVGSPGLYALGLPVLRRRRSTFMCGTEDDARQAIEHLARYLAARH
jgi:putative flavoprotein involved in K+ transport